MRASRPGSAPASSGPTQPKRPRGRDGRAKGAGGRRLMEAALVMGTAEHQADAYRGFRPDQKRVEQPTASFAGLPSAMAAGSTATEG